MIPIYKQEEMDGLSDQLKGNSIAFLCPHIKRDIPSKVDVKALKEKAVALGYSENFGLYLIDSILVSLGWNGNDDVFTKAATWTAKASAIDKPVNFMHDEKDIIGHMTASIVVDKKGNIIPSDSKLEDVPDDFDIVVASVLYTQWSDEKLQARMDNLIKDIPEGKWFVSMECLFNDFDYAVITPTGEHKTVARNQDTAFLTKYLRIYGGTGEYQGHKIGRQLKNFTFIGKGIVDNPANKESIILTESFISKANLNNFPEIKVNKMDEKMALELQAKVDTVVKTVAELAAAESKKVSDEAAKQITDLKAELDAAKAQIAELTGKVTASEEAVAKKTEELKTVANELVSVKRLSKAAIKGIKEEDAKKLVETWASVSEEQFDSILAMHNTETKSTTTASQVLETVEKKDEAALVTPPVDNNKEVRAKASAWLQASLSPKKDKN